MDKHGWIGVVDIIHKNIDFGTVQRGLWIHVIGMDHAHG